MAAIDIRTQDASTFIGIESTYGTTPTMTRIYPVVDSFEPNTETTEIPNDDESALLYDVHDPVQGLESAAPKFEVYVRPDASQLTQGATPATPWLGTVFKAALGGEATPTAGSLIEASSTTTVVNVTAGQGSRFTAEVPILVDVAGVPEPTIVTSIATDALTLKLALSGSPTTGQDVIQLYNYYPAATNTTSFTLRHAYAGNAARQWTLNGCVASDVTLSIARNALVKFGVTCKGAAHTGPSDQSISVAYAADTMDPPFPGRESICVLQSTSTSTRTHYPIHSFAIKMSNGMELIPELGGTTEGVVGAMRVGPRLFAEITLRIRADNVRDSTDWLSRTSMYLLLALSRGSGATKRWFTVYAPKVIIVGKPKTIREGGRDLMEFVLHTKINTSGATANIPIVFSFG